MRWTPGQPYGAADHGGVWCIDRWVGRHVPFQYSKWVKHCLVPMQMNFSVVQVPLISALKDEIAAAILLF